MKSGLFVFFQAGALQATWLNYHAGVLHDFHPPSPQVLDVPLSAVRDVRRMLLTDDSTLQALNTRAPLLQSEALYPKP